MMKKQPFGYHAIPRFLFRTFLLTSSVRPRSADKIFLYCFGYFTADLFLFFMVGINEAAQSQQHMAAADFALTDEQQNAAYNRQLAYLLYVFPSYPLFTIKNVFDACNCVISAAYRVLDNHTNAVARERARTGTELNNRSWISSYSSPLPYGSVTSMPNQANPSGLISQSVPVYPNGEVMALGDGNIRSRIMTSYPLPSYTNGVCATGQFASLDESELNGRHLHPVTCASAFNSAMDGPIWTYSSMATSSAPVVSTSSCIDGSGAGVMSVMTTSESEQTTNEAAAALMQLTIKTAVGHTSS